MSHLCRLHSGPALSRAGPHSPGPRLAKCRVADNYRVFDYPRGHETLSHYLEVPSPILSLYSDEM